MSQSPRATNQTTTKPVNGPLVLLLTALDTTWRAFVPTIGGTLAGIGLDTVLHTIPVFTTIFIIAGFLCSGLLIFLQLKRVRREIRS